MTKPTPLEIAKEYLKNNPRQANFDLNTIEETEMFILCQAFIEHEEKTIKVRDLLLREIDRRNVKLNEARAVIEFYADPQSWHFTFGKMPKVIDNPDNAKLGEAMIGGRRAREFLERFPNEKEKV